MRTVEWKAQRSTVIVISNANLHTRYQTYSSSQPQNCLPSKLGNAFPHVGHPELEGFSQSETASPQPQPLFGGCRQVSSDLPPNLQLCSDLFIHQALFWFCDPLLASSLSERSATPSWDLSGLHPSKINSHPTCSIQPFSIDFAHYYSSPSRFLYIISAYNSYY